MKDGTPVGPLDEQDFLRCVREGEIGRSALVWSDGMDDWTKAGAVRGLFAPPPRQTSAPEPTSQPSPVSEAKASPRPALNYYIRGGGYVRGPFTSAEMAKKLASGSVERTYEIAEVKPKTKPRGSDFKPATFSAVWNGSAEADPISTRTEVGTSDFDAPDLNQFSDSISDQHGSEYEDEPTFLSYRGRLRRSSYFLQSLALIVPVVVFNAIIGQSPEAAPIGAVLFLLAAIVLSFPQVKRLHDLGLSGWWYWLGLIPLVNLLFGLYVLFAPGTDGRNQYGPDPHELTAA